MEGVCDGSLIAARNALLMQPGADIGAVCSAIRTLRAERDRYQRALEMIADPCEPLPNDGRSVDRIYEDLARAALAPAEEVKP